MARDWRRAVLAAFAAIALGCACALGAFAQQAEEGGQEQDEAKGDAKAKKKQDPAEAQRTIDAALKQVLAGKLEQAVQAATATMAGGNLPPAIMAKALYVRGMAYRKQGRTAQAISDLTGALWLKGGLGGEDRESAAKEKAAAYADAGLADPGASPPAPKSAGGGGNWLSGIFGLGSDPSPPPKAQPKVSSAPPPEAGPPPSPPPKAPPGPRTLSSWSSSTEVQEPPPKSPPKASLLKAPPPKAPPPKAPSPKAPPPPKTAKAAPPPAPSGKKALGPHQVQLAAMRTEAEALALAAKAKRDHASLLGSRGQSIERQVYGNMGAYYRVRFGPFASTQETQTVCAKLRGSGIDCLPVNQ
jgi:cell division septation protein DedD